MIELLADKDGVVFYNDRGHVRSTMVLHTLKLISFTTIMISSAMLSEINYGKSGLHP